MLALGLEMMKFCVNHPDQFKSFIPPFLAGFLIFYVTVLNEICIIFFTATFTSVLDAVQKQVSL